MKKIFVLLAFIMLAAPAFAQEAEDADRIATDHEAPGHDEREFEVGQLAQRQYLEQLRRHGIDAASIRDAWLRTHERDGKSSGRAASGAVWEFLGPKNQSGRIMGVAVAYDNPDLWFCAADGGGIWRSTTAGSTWVPLTDTLPSLRMGAIAISPRSNQLVLGGTHEGLIYRSQDGGGTWSVIPLPGGYVHDIQFDPARPGNVLVGAEGGLFLSTDDGASWTKARPAGRVQTVTFNPHDSSKIFFGENDEGGDGHIWRSTDGGRTWTDVLKRTAAYWGNVGVRLCAAQPNILYASFADSDTFLKSTDGGNTWSELPTQPRRDGYNRGFDVFAVSPVNPDIVMSGSTGIFRTTDGGATWIAGDTINTALHVDQHAMLFPPGAPGMFIAGNDGGIFATADYTTPNVGWSAFNTDLATLQIYNCAMHPTQIDTVIVGCQDNGYDKFSGNEHGWLVVGGDGFCTIYDRDTPAYFYHEYVYQNLHRADNGFTWWSPKVMNGLPTDTSGQGFYSGIIDPERADWFGQGIAMSPVDSKTLYMGTNFLYKTTDRAQNWKRVSDQEYAGDVYDYISSIAPAPGNASRIYLGTIRGRIFRVHDESPVAAVDITPSFATSDRIRGIVVSNNNSDLVYAGGDAGYSGKGVIMSTDAGATWTVRSNGLPQAGVNRLMADPDSAGTLYCATTAGLYYTRDGGASWRIMPGLPNVEVWDLAFNAPTRTLLLGTYGRGAIRARNFVPPAVEPESGVTAPADPANASLDVVTGSDGAIVRLQLATPRALTITLYDYLGRVAAHIHSGYLAAGSHQFALGASEALALPSGVYFVEARGDGVALQARCVMSR